MVRWITNPPASGGSSPWFHPLFLAHSNPGASINIIPLYGLIVKVPSNRTVPPGTVFGIFFP